MKKIQYILFIFFIVFINSCSSTQIVNSWRDPDKHIHAGDWKKVLVHDQGKKRRSCTGKNQSRI